MFAITLSPNKWSDIMFQDHVITTLQNALKSGDFPNVLLLTGESGVGKTSIARVYSAAVLCENLKDGNPCGECINCQDIFSDRMSRNCLKIDGGTQNTKDHFRKILDSIQQGGTVFGDKRVLIIEEAHGLTKDALESLLVPTENKKNVDIFFIFTTTERSKIKNTLKSRSMDFNLVTPDGLSLSKYLNKIIKNNGWDVPEYFRVNMLFDVIESCNFNVRDCLNTLHKVYLSGEYTQESISKLITAVPRNNIYRLLKGFFEGEKANFITVLEKYCEEKTTEEVFYSVFYALLNLQKAIKFNVYPEYKYYKDMVKGALDVDSAHMRNRNMYVTKMLDSLSILKNAGNIYERGSFIYAIVSI